MAFELHEVGASFLRGIARQSSRRSRGERSVEDDRGSIAQQSARLLHERLVRFCRHRSRVDPLVQAVALGSMLPRHCRHIAAHLLTAQVHPAHCVGQSRRQRRLTGAGSSSDDDQQRTSELEMAAALMEDARAPMPSLSRHPA